MSRKPKTKPKNPLLIASERARKALEQRVRDFGAVSLPPDAAALPAQADIEVKRESQRNAEVARRVDAFDLLRANLAPGAYDAVRGLERDMLVRARLTGVQGTGERVGAPGGTTDAAVAAGIRVDQLAERMPPRDWWLLHNLITSRKPWREIVSYVTGETHEHAQSAAVRAACVNLRDMSSRRITRAA